MENYSISLDIIELEMKAILAFLEKFHSDGYSTAIIEAREIEKNWILTAHLLKPGIERKNDYLIISVKMKMIIILRR